MHNNLTKEEIKNSVECQWRKFHAKQLSVIYLIIAAATLFVPLILLMQYGMEYLGQGIITWLICILVLGLFFGGFVLYYYSKYPKGIGDLLDIFSAAMGLILAMAGTCCLLLLISTVCFMRGMN